MAKAEDHLRFKKISDQRHKTYRTIFSIVNRFELNTHKPIKLDKASADTLVALEKFSREEHTFFEPIKGKYRAEFKRIKKYKYSGTILSKTKEERQRVVKIYLAPTVIEIPNRYKGKTKDYISPFMTMGKLNDLINHVEITRVVTSTLSPSNQSSTRSVTCR